MERLAIFGLGLIGGSLGLALRARFPHLAITGIDRPPVLAHPAARRAAHELVSAEAEDEVARAFEGANLVVFSAPVSVIQRELPRALDRAQVVVDCGSTKRAICAAAASHPRRGRFVPSHPMAGAPEGGIEQAREDLFEGKRWLLCPERSDADALSLVETLIASVGSSSLALSAEEHDRAVARTSHLPQLLASALRVVASRAGAERAAGPAFASATRVAGGPEAIWQDIFATNADEIARALAELSSELATVERELAQSPAVLDAARSLLSRAREQRGR